MKRQWKSEHYDFYATTFFKRVVISMYPERMCYMFHEGLYHVRGCTASTGEVVSNVCRRK
jgi:hypothetical protein